MTRLLLVTIAAGCAAQTVPNIRDAISCPNTPDGRQPYRVSTQASGDLRRVVLNAPNALCNDGSPAEMFVRAARAGAMEPDGPSANRWVIHFLGGASCSAYEECFARWCGLGRWEGTLMTTRFSGNFRNADGLLGRNGINRLGDRNQVLLKYCSSDQWQGRKANAVLRSELDPSRVFSLHFQGASIVAAVLDALERGVEGMPRLTAATDVLVSGDSAGSSGAKTHLDRIAARLRAVNPNVRVKGGFEAGFGINLNGSQGTPPGDPRDPLYSFKTESHNRVQAGLYDAQLDDSCVAAHPTAPYLCTDEGYLALNHLTAPFFQISDIQDPLMVDALVEKELGTPVQIAQRMRDQLQELTNIRSTALERAAMTQAPGVVARNCGVHVTWGNDDGFLGKKIRSGPGAEAYSYYDVLWNWLHGITPSTVLAPRPPDTPNPPATDSICNARAPSAPAAPSLATANSASYDFNRAVAPESIVVTFGTNLAAATATATTAVWPTTLGGIQVTVTDSRNTPRLAPLYYVSPTQIMYLVPAGTAAGAAAVAIGTQRAAIQVAPTAPGIYSANQRGQGVAAASYVRITARGGRSEGLLFDPNTALPVGVPAAAGDQIYLILYGTGLRGGAATVTVGDVVVPVAGPVAQGQFLGLDQINLGPLPLRIGYGTKLIVVRQGDDLSNDTSVTFVAP